jgi:TonB family protein
MIHAFNFFIEANICLMAVLLVYRIMLANETAFHTMRMFLLFGMLISVAIPFLEFPITTDSLNLPAIGKVIAENWLPEIVITQDGMKNSIDTFDLWTFVRYSYLGGLSIFLIYFLFQIVVLVRTIYQSKTYKLDNVYVSESASPLPTFSFFNFVFVGNINDLTLHEKKQIIRHEMFHARNFHSFDILFANLLAIVFWFNPTIRMFKKYFVQIHEFEADARAVENQDVNGYCNLLARVALQSAGIPLGNHFNNSLTIKRIQMIRTLKSNMKWWRITGATVMILLLTFFFACQDQMATSDFDVKNLPVAARDQFEQFKKQFPGETFIVEYNESADEKLATLDTKYGNPKHQELFTITEEGKKRTFAMLVYQLKDTNAVTKVSASNDIYEVVDVMPEFEGGFPALAEFIGSNLSYPSTARERGIEGTTYVSFIVEKDGSISDVQLKQGFDSACDAESLRVINSMKNWTPAQTKGEIVRARMILPIKFKL